MSSRTKRPVDAASRGDEPATNTVIRVRRGSLRRFDQLKQKSADLPVDIKWDRRTDDRRAPADAPDGERWSGERRQAPPFTWDTADFVVVGDRTPQTDRLDPPASSTKPRK